ncbi:hypothetical protein HC776_02575, partial [bacterium]|nr:hypothetical protein [bacterium]
MSIHAHTTTSPNRKIRYNIAMQTLITTLKLAFVLLVALSLVAALTYWAATEAVAPPLPAVQAAYALTPVTYLNGTPVMRYARVNPAIVDVLA